MRNIEVCKRCKKLVEHITYSGGYSLSVTKRYSCNWSRKYKEDYWKKMKVHKNCHLKLEQTVISEKENK